MLVRRLAPESAARTRAAGNTDSSRKDCLASPDCEGIASRHLPVQIVCQQTTTNWDPGHSGISLMVRAPSRKFQSDLDPSWSWFAGIRFGRADAYSRSLHSLGLLSSPSGTSQCCPLPGFAPRFPALTCERALPTGSEKPVHCSTMFHPESGSNFVIAVA